MAEIDCYEPMVRSATGVDSALDPDRSTFSWYNPRSSVVTGFTVYTIVVPSDPVNLES